MSKTQIKWTDATWNPIRRAAPGSDGNELTALGKDRIDKLVLKARNQAKQALYAAGRQITYPGKTRNGHGIGRPRAPKPRQRRVL